MPTRIAGAACTACAANSGERKWDVAGLGQSANETEGTIFRIRRRFAQAVILKERRDRQSLKPPAFSEWEISRCALS